MICIEVSKMRMGELLKKVIVPIGAAIFWVTLFYPLCVENGVCDYLKLWILVGIPFGIQRMFIWVIPKGFDLGGTVGTLVINLLVGGVIGGMIMAWRLVMAAAYLVRYVCTGIFRLVGKSKKILSE